VGGGGWVGGIWVGRGGGGSVKTTDFSNIPISSCLSNRVRAVGLKCMAEVALIRRNSLRGCLSPQWPSGPVHTLPLSHFR
jgi:hypothetical protein